MAYPSRIWEVVQDITINNEYVPATTTISAVSQLGEIAEKFVAQYLPPSPYLLATLLQHRRSVRRLANSKQAPAAPKPFPNAFNPQTSFAIDQLPAELLLMVCEQLDTLDLISLFGISKTMKAIEDDILYRCVYKKEFPMIYQGLTSNGQPILRDDLNDLNNRRSNWRKGTFSVNYVQWRDVDTSTGFKTEVKALDENWAVAMDDEQIFLWNCHDHQQHTLFTRSIGMYAQVSFLDSPPDRLPNMVIGSYHHIDLFVNNGKKKRYFIKDAFGFEGHFQNYYASIGKDKIISGKAPVIWSVDREQKICDISSVSNVKKAAYNPCTGMTVLSSGDGSSADGPSEYTFLDKNFQVVLTTPHQKLNATLYHHIQWMDEYHVVQLSSSGTLITDLRMLKPEQHYLEKKVISPFCGSSMALEAQARKSLATVWDLNSRLWENVIVLPEDVRDTSATNSRYAVFSTNQTGRLCVLDWQ